jgi:hypothetical protein
VKPDTGDVEDVTAVVSGFSRTVIQFTALSLIAGIFVIGRTYDQYYALLLPLLAVLGGSLAASLLDRVDASRWPALTGAVIIALAAFSLAISARGFSPIAPQLADITFVTTRTNPADSYVGGSPGAALFRPHAWFYFFLTGEFASADEYAALVAALDARRVRPRIVIRDRYFDARASPALRAFIDGHYRVAQGEIYLRQSEYGSASLNTSDASERFDRPLTR